MTREEWTRVYNTRGFEGALLFGRSLLGVTGRGEDGGDDVARLPRRNCLPPVVCRPAPAPFSFSFSFPISISIPFLHPPCRDGVRGVLDLFQHLRDAGRPSSPSRGRTHRARLPRNSLPRFSGHWNFPPSTASARLPPACAMETSKARPAARTRTRRTQLHTPTRSSTSHGWRVPQPGALNGAVHPPPRASLARRRPGDSAPGLVGRAEPKSISTAEYLFPMILGIERGGGRRSRVSRRTFPGLRSRWA